jgi:lipopolysaccharide export system protein LptA
MTRPTRLLPALALAAAFAATLAGPPAARAEGAADIFAGFQAKSTDPIEVNSATLEVYEQDKQRVSVFSGGVTVKRGNTTMKAGEIKLFSPLDAQSADGFTRIEANGKIQVISGPQKVTGNSAVVDMVASTITVDGGVVLSQGPNVISGSRLVVNLKTGRARVEQAPGQQIRGVFSPGNVTIPAQ